MQTKSTLWGDQILRLEEILEVIWEMSGEVEGIFIRPPASLEKVNGVEIKLGIKLPESFRQTLLNFSSLFKVQWSLEDEELLIEVPDEFKRFSCDFGWELDNLVFLNRDKGKMTREIPKNHLVPSMKKKLIFHQFENGDYLYFDLNVKLDSPVFYSTYFNNEVYDLFLGENFSDFFHLWTTVGCIGTKLSDFKYFVSSPTSGIECFGENAMKWFKWLEVSIE